MCEGRSVTGTVLCRFFYEFLFTVSLLFSFWWQLHSLLFNFLGMNAKFRKAIISFVMSVCLRLSVRLEQLGSH